MGDGRAFPYSPWCTALYCCRSTVDPSRLRCLHLHLKTVTRLNPDRCHHFCDRRRRGPFHRRPTTNHRSPIAYQVCPDGRPKVVDIVDCTGSGDVDTSTVIKGDAVKVNTADGKSVREIKGLSGRCVRVPTTLFCVLT